MADGIFTAGTTPASSLIGASGAAEQRLRPGKNAGSTRRRVARARPTASSPNPTAGDDESITLEEDQAQLLIDTACQIQDLMKVISVLVYAEENADHLRELVKTLALTSKELARNISWALGNPEEFGWSVQHMKVHGEFPELKNVAEGAAS